MSNGSAALTFMRLLLLFLVAATTATASPAIFSSGLNRTHLVELYSSEGCSSCPPAEAWLGNLRDAPGLWSDFVPLAFHVSYWDRLGWTDRFAGKENTARQYAYAREWGGESVYTPEFVLDGVEWRTASQRNPPSRSIEKAALLSVQYEAGGVCRVNYAETGDCEVHVALLGGGIVSEVRAGENQGSTLRHDFVVLAMQTAQLKGGTAELSLPESKVKGVLRHALAVWVTRRGELTPRQATGGWLD